MEIKICKMVKTNFNNIMLLKMDNSHFYVFCATSQGESSLSILTGFIMNNKISQKYTRKVTK